MWGSNKEDRTLERIAIALESLEKTEKLRLEEDKDQTSTFQDVAKILQEILKVLTPVQEPGIAVAFQILLGGDLMKKGSVLKLRTKFVSLAAADAAPTPITDAPTGQRISVVGLDAQGVYGAPLASGATIVITVANGAKGAAAVCTPDATPASVNFTDASGVARTGILSLISGILASVVPPNVNDPFVVTYTITNADGSAGGTGSATLSVVPGTEVSEVIVFPTS